MYGLRLCDLVCDSPLQRGRRVHDDRLGALDRVGDVLHTWVVRQLVVRLPVPAQFRLGHCKVNQALCQHLIDSHRLMR